MLAIKIVSENINSIIATQKNANPLRLYSTVSPPSVIPSVKPRVITRAVFNDENNDNTSKDILERKNSATKLTLLQQSASGRLLIRSKSNNNMISPVSETSTSASTTNTSTNNATSPRALVLGDTVTARSILKHQKSIYNASALTAAGQSVNKPNTKSQSENVDGTQSKKDGPITVTDEKGRRAFAVTAAPSRVIAKPKLQKNSSKSSIDIVDTLPNSNADNDKIGKKISPLLLPSNNANERPLPQVNEMMNRPLPPISTTNAETSTKTITINNNKPRIVKSPSVRSASDK